MPQQVAIPEKQSAIGHSDALMCDGGGCQGVGQQSYQLRWHLYSTCRPEEFEFRPDE